MNETTKRILKILLMAVGYFALIAVVTFILSLVRQEEYHFNWLICTVGGFAFALMTEFMPANRLR